MALQLYDTMTRKKRAFVPINPERVTMYVCGPTVYNYAHIGNARPVVVFDVLFRLLRSIYRRAPRALRGQRHRRGRQDQPEGHRRGRADRDDHGALPRRLPRRHVGAGRAEAHVRAPRHRHDGRDHRHDRAAGAQQRGLRGPGPRAVQHRGLFRLRQALRPLAGRHDRRRPGRRRALQAEPGRLRALEAVEAGRAGVGKPVRSGPARLAHRVLGDDRARRWACRSTSTAAATT